MVKLKWKLVAGILGGVVLLLFVIKYTSVIVQMKDNITTSLFYVLFSLTVVALVLLFRFFMSLYKQLKYSFKRGS